jgi:hypothetical protein
MYLSIRAIKPSATRVSSSARLVSSTSLDVMPRCSQRAGSPASSSTCVRNAITSCFVVRSMVSMRAGSSCKSRARSWAAVPEGTSPRASMAAHAASSTSSQVA